jgi:nucleolar protein 15
MPRKVKEEEDDGVKIYLPEDVSDEDIEEMEQAQVELEEASPDEFEQGESKISLSELPKKSKKELKEIAKLSKDSADAEPGVVYLGHIPHGFYEEEMRAYFSQFGTVNRLRLSRNKKTGKSKHYAFIEFQSREVAQIVCDTMDNYLLSNHVLKCKLVPTEKIHPGLFKGAGERYKVLPWNKIQRLKHNRKKNEAEQQLHIEGLQAKDAKKRQKLKDLGIDYDFEGHKKRTSADSAETPSKKPKVEDSGDVASTVAKEALNQKFQEKKSKVTVSSQPKKGDSKAKTSPNKIQEMELTKGAKETVQKSKPTGVQASKPKTPLSGSKVKKTKPKTPRVGKKSMK